MRLERLRVSTLVLLQVCVHSAKVEDCKEGKWGQECTKNCPPNCSESCHRILGICKEKSWQRFWFPRQLSYMEILIIIISFFVFGFGVSLMCFHRKRDEGEELFEQEANRFRSMKSTNKSSPTPNAIENEDDDDDEDEDEEDEDESSFEDDDDDEDSY